jgi:hypothetical protein
VHRCAAALGTFLNLLGRLQDRLREWLCVSFSSVSLWLALFLTEQQQRLILLHCKTGLATAML